MLNPLSVFRKEYLITQAELAEAANVTITVISRTEAGTYASIPPSVIEAVDKLRNSADLKFGPTALSNAYHDWVLFKLKQVKLPAPFIDPQRDMTPEQLKVWFSVVCRLNQIPETVISFCGLLKINIYVIDKFLKGRMKQIPEALLERVKQIRGFGGDSDDEDIAA